MTTPESLYQAYLTTKSISEKRKYLEDAIKLGTNVLQIHCSYFTILTPHEQEIYLKQFPCNDSSAALFYTSILQAVASVDASLLREKLDKDKLLSVSKHINYDVPDHRVAILFLYGLYINTSKDVELSTIDKFPLNNIDKDYLRVIYFCTKGFFIEAADVLINNTDGFIPVPPNILLNIISQLLFIDRNRALKIISIVKIINNKLSAKEQEELSKYIDLAKNETVQIPDSIEKKGSSPLISRMFVEAVGIKDPDDGLQIVTGLFETAIESGIKRNLDAFLEAAKILIHKSHRESHHSVYKMLEILDNVFQDQIEIKILMLELAHNEHLISRMLEGIKSEEQLKELECLGLLYNNDLLGAIDYFYKLSETKPCAKILNHIIGYDALWNQEEKEALDAVMADIIANKQEHDYYEPINLYLRLLLNNYSEDEAISRLSIFSEGIPAPYMIANAHYRNKNYLATYETIMSNLDAVKNFDPLGVWLINSASEINKVQELIDTLSESKEVAIQQIVTTAKESLGLQSDRAYLHSKDIITERLDIIFCINKTYLEGFKVAFTSLIINNQNILKNLYFHIGFDNSVDREELHTFLDNYKVNYVTKNLELDYETKDLKYDYGFTTDHYLDKSAYYRIFMIDHILEKMPEVSRILYLDSDVLVLSNIIELTNIKMNKPLMAYPEDQNAKAVLQSRKQNLINKYFNSGVLLVDCTNELVKRCIKNSIKQSYENVDNLIMHDQCALNIGFNNNFDELPVSYNFLIHQNEFGLRKPSVTILHLSGRTKPWQHHYHDEEFISNLWHTYRRTMKLWKKNK